MKKLSLLVCMLFAILLLKAQAPNLIQYQGVLFDDQGDAISNQTVQLRLSIVPNDPSGEAAYIEIHEIEVEDEGYFNINIGGGIVEGAPFESIEWGSASHFLNVELDENLSGEFEFLGSTQFLSTPYAKFANTINDPAFTGPAGEAGPEGAQGPEGPQGAQGAQGDQGAQGPAGPPGLQGPPGPTGTSGATGATGPQGPSGLNGPNGPAGPPGPSGEIGASADILPGPDTINCWDTNTNNQEDESEDINEDGLWNYLDCLGIGSDGPQGPQGPQGPTGPGGPIGLPGAQGFAGSVGPTGIQGPPGPPNPNIDGPDALHCWDLNGNGIGDEEEDKNGDGHLSALDCRGIDGPQGPSGPTGPTGLQGPQGQQGPLGLQGEMGDMGNQGPAGADYIGIEGQQALHCWDVNMNYQADPSEDINGDGIFNAWDCRPQGPSGATGANGPAGPTGPVGFGGVVCAIPPISGEAGDQGPVGPPGQSGDSVWMLNDSEDVIYYTESNVGIGGAPYQGGKLEVGGDTYAGDIYANGILLSSDMRYKENIQPLKEVKEKLLQISGVSYDYDADAHPDMHFPEKDQIGLIAQEVEKFFPEMVITKANGYKAVDYTKLSPLLLELLKGLDDDLNEIIDATHKQSELKQNQQEYNATLKAQNERIKAEIVHIKALLETINN